MSVRSFRVMLSSTPSATTVIPRLCPRSTAERTITALSGSFVRAMAIVPRLFDRPLPASFLIGSLAFFCLNSGSKPPPWIMKSSFLDEFSLPMTRWKMVPS